MMPPPPMLLMPSARRLHMLRRLRFFAPRRCHDYFFLRFLRDAAAAACYAAFAAPRCHAMPHTLAAAALRSCCWRYAMLLMLIFRWRHYATRQRLARARCCCRRDLPSALPRDACCYMMAMPQYAFVCYARCFCCHAAATPMLMLMLMLRAATRCCAAALHELLRAGCRC